ncbi:hypothetical protein BGZ94_003716 [Podila epigama]|nr:hypothetical protein BGZ94_003716 [Podila epigama]
MVKLRVSVGGSYTDLAIINCNDELHPIEFEGPEFKGRAVVRIKDFVGITNDGSEPVHDAEYFHGRNRRFSIQVEGRFKRQWDGEQVYFGTDFDHDVDLPDGFEMMLRVARYIDPVVRTSLSKDGQPWILSPLVSSINTLAAWRPQDADLPSPPLTPRGSSDLANGVVPETSGGTSSSMWGFLGKFKRSNKRSSVISNSSNDIYGSQPTSPTSSQMNMADQGSSQFDTNSMSSSSTSTDWVTAASENSGGHESATVPSDASIQAGALSGEGVVVEEQKATDGEKEDDGMALGHWRQHLEEDTTFYMPNGASISTTQRRKYFQSEAHRKGFVYRTDLVHGFEFFSPHMDFNTFDIRMGLSMNIRKYLTGQPVRYTCRTLNGDTVFWAVQFELVD